MTTKTTPSPSSSSPDELTTISVTNSTRDKLYALKQSSPDTYNNVIERLIELGNRHNLEYLDI